MGGKRKKKNRASRSVPSAAAAIQSAVKAHQEGRFEEAAAAYRSLLKRRPKNLPALINLGQALRRMGQEDEALACYHRAAALPGAGYEVWYNLGNLQLDRRDYPASERSFGRALKLAPKFAPAIFQLGCVFRDQGKYDLALEQYQSAALVDPSLGKAQMNAGNMLRALGRLDEALRCHKRALALAPESWEVHYNLARALDEAEDRAGSGKHLGQALALAPEPSEVHYQMAQALADRREFIRAEGHYQKALALAPDRLHAWIGLAQVYLRSGRQAEAVAAFSKVAKRAGEDVFLLTELATMQWRYKFWHEAVAVLKRIRDIRPDEVDSHTNLARALSKIWELEAALNSCDRALAIDSDSHLAMQLRGTNLVKQGRIEEGLEAYSRAERLDQGDEEGFAHSLFSSLYSDQLTPEEVAKLHRDQTSLWDQATKSAPATYANSPDPDRKLRIGYLSPDFKARHPVAIFIEPVLRHHDKTSMEIFCYSSVDAIDQTTAEFEKLSQNWCEVYGWHDGQLINRVRQDGIDILVDLAGHTSGSRLRAMAGRPAPVQACFIGYPHSTGLGAIDYLIADPVVCPPENDHLCSERVVRLDGCVFCYSGDQESPPVDLEAAGKRSRITFGSFNNVPKLTPTTISLWSKILSRLPESKLKLKAAPFTDRATRERYWQQFQDLGIARERVEIVGPTSLYEMMGEYGDLDIALDPVPYNGGTTTLQALWMGPPVLTLAGGNFCSRMSASVLGVIGLEELVAESPEEYVEIAVDLARNPDRLLALRAGMRQRLLASSLCDGHSYTRNLEALYRDMWRRWCRSSDS
ncbi:MAG: tetratricopeptide repeat protein [Sphingomonadales bacterium]